MAEPRQRQRHVGRTEAGAHCHWRRTALSARDRGEQLDVATRVPFIFQLPTTSLRRVASCSFGSPLCQHDLPTCWFDPSAHALRGVRGLEGSVGSPDAHARPFDPGPDVLAQARDLRLKATGRRSVEPVIVRRRRSTRPASKPDCTPPCTAMMTMRAVPARQFTCGDVAARHHVEMTSAPLPSVRRFTRRRSRVRSVVGTERHARRALLVAAGGDDHRRTGRLGELDRGDADAAGAPLHQQRLAGLQAGRSNTLDQTVKKVSGLAARRRSGRWAPAALPGSVPRTVGIAAAGDHAQTRSPRLEAGHRPSPRCRRRRWTPGHLQARLVGTPTPAADRRPLRCSTSGRFTPEAVTRDEQAPHPRRLLDRRAARRCAARLRHSAHAGGRSRLPRGMRPSVPVVAPRSAAPAGAAGAVSRSSSAFIDSLTRPFVVGLEHLDLDDLASFRKSVTFSTRWCAIWLMCSRPSLAGQQVDERAGSPGSW